MYIKTHTQICKDKNNSKIIHSNNAGPIEMKIYPYGGYKLDPIKTIPKPNRSSEKIIRLLIIKHITLHIIKIDE